MGADLVWVLTNHRPVFRSRDQYRPIRDENYLEQGSEARPGAAPKTMKDEESLRPRCIFDFSTNLQVMSCFNSFKTFQFPVSHFTFYLLQDILQDLFADSIMSPEQKYKCTQNRFKVQEYTFFILLKVCLKWKS